MQVAQQARNENGQYFFMKKIPSKEKKRYALPSGPDGTRRLKGLAELEKRCQNMRQEGSE